MKLSALVKFEQVTKKRIKSLSFHPTRPWIIVGDRNGDVELWDYRLEILIHRYEAAHAGPIRCVLFHHEQPMFATCGDDMLIRLWSTKNHKCLFSLQGHSDYVRSISFHRDLPWIASGSDDNTVKIWDWQARTILATLPGHTSYVMSVCFHSRMPYLVTGSLDGTARVWNYSSLVPDPEGAKGGLSMPSLLAPLVVNNDSRVNSVMFHPTEATFVCATDANQVRVWNARGDLLKTYSCHKDHIASAVFYKKLECIVTASEDGTVNCFSTTARFNPTAPILEREGSKFWGLSVHPTNGFIAAGHETGFVIFRLVDDSPIFFTDAPAPKSAASATLAAGPSSAPGSAPRVFYLTRSYNHEKAGIPAIFVTPATPGSVSSEPAPDYASMHYKGGMPTPVLTFPPPQEEMVNATAHLSGNMPIIPFRHAKSIHLNMWNRSIVAGILCHSDNTYQLTTKETGCGLTNAPFPTPVEEKHATGYAKSVAFVSSTRFVTLDRNKVIFLRSLSNEPKRRVVVPGAQHLFTAGIGRVLIRCTDSLLLLDVNVMRPVAETPLPARSVVENALWSGDGRYVVIYGRNHALIATTKLDIVARVNESTAIVSATWDPAGVVVYSTETQIKYLIPGGDTGVLRSIPEPVFIAHANSSEIVCKKPYANGILFRGHDFSVIKANSVEYLFKLALLRHKSGDVARLMQSKKLVGQSIVAYVQKKGFPEIAMHFVRDMRLKFALALECGNIAVAKDAAESIDETACWQQLGAEALRHGAYDVAEAAFFRARDFQRLSFLALILGDTHKLHRLRTVAATNNNPDGSFHASLLLGDVPARASALAAAGHTSLAYASAVAHGQTELAERIATAVAATLQEHHARRAAAEQVLAEAAAKEGVDTSEAEAELQALGPAPLAVPDLKTHKANLMSMEDLDAAIAADNAYAGKLAAAGAAAAAASSGVFVCPATVTHPSSFVEVSTESEKAIAAAGGVASGVPQPPLPPILPSAAIEGSLLLPPPRAWPLAGPWPRVAVTTGFDFSREGTDADAAEAAEAAAEEAERLAAAKLADEQDMGWDSSSSSRTGGAAASAGAAAAAAGRGSSAATPSAGEGKEAGDAAAGGGDWDLGMDLGDELDDIDATPDVDEAAAAKAAEMAAVAAGQFVFPDPGVTPQQAWAYNPLPGPLVASGAYAQAMHLLNQCYGITNFAPYKKIFVQYTLLGKASVPMLPAMPSRPAYYSQICAFKPQPDNGRRYPDPPVVAALPMLRFTAACAAEALNEMLTAMTAGSFPLVLELAATLLLNTPLRVVFKEDEAKEALDKLVWGREYTLALRLDAARNAASDPVRKAELAAYATHCLLAPPHLVLMLWIACKYMFQIKNYRTVGTFCRRILDLAASEDLSSLAGKVDVETVRKMLRKCEMEGKDAVQVHYDPTVQFAICASSLVPIAGAKAAEGSEVVVCGLCGAKHAIGHSGKLCSICHVAKLGAPASGPRIVLP